MTPQQLLDYCDSGQLWPGLPSDDAAFDVAAAYRSQLAVRELRIARGERPRGFKIGFTNRGIWPRYKVYAPIWATVWDTTLSSCDGAGSVRLGQACQPRLEPEAVFGLADTPVPGATLEQLFDCLDWVAPGFEIVQSHSASWQFRAADTVADGGLHAKLLVGAHVPVRDLATTAAELEDRLAACSVRLLKQGELVDEGRGANVLDGPLHALAYFLNELQHCPGAPALLAGDVVTTGTWTDAWPVAAGQTWSAEFSAPLPSLRVEFV